MDATATQTTNGDSPIEAPPEVGIRCACATIWDLDGKPVALKDLADDPVQRELAREARQRDGAVWIEFELTGEDDALRWFEPSIEPWDSFVHPTVRWSDVAEVLALFDIPQPDSPGRDPVASTLHVLPWVYTYGVRRARTAMNARNSDDVILLPLIGFQEPPPDYLRTWMVRLTLARVDSFVFTVRLPDRPWPLFSSFELDEPAGTLVVPNRFVPRAGQPTPQELAETIAFYQEATCDAVMAKARRWLGRVEREFMQDSPDSMMDGVSGSTSEDLALKMLDPAVLRGKFYELFRLGVRAEELERELTHIVARFDGGHVGLQAEAIRGSFQERLLAARSFLQDLRQRGDGITSMVATQQFALAERQQKATEGFQQRVTIVTAAVLIPALVAAVFGANVDLPGKDQARALAAMLLFMVALGAGTWWGIASLEHSDARLTTWPWKSEYAHIHASFFVALVTLGFGVATLTPAVENTISRQDATVGIAGALLIALGLGVLVYCLLDGARSSGLRDRPHIAARVTLAGRVLGPLAVLAGLYLVTFLV